MNGWIKATVVGSQQNSLSQYRKSVRGVQGIKISLFEMRPFEANLKQNSIGYTDEEGNVLFQGLGYGFYVVRCNDDVYTDHIIEVDARTFNPDVKLVKFEVNL